MSTPLPPSPGSPSDEASRLARQWTRTLWNAGLWRQVSWLGVPVLQWPTDLLLLQELMTRLRPRFVLETGLHLGGTAIFYASILRLLGIDGRVVSVDVSVSPEARKNLDDSAFRDQITVIEGDSKSEAVHRRIETLLQGEPNVLVCLDSDHARAHALAELRLFSRYVPVGGYLVLLDTICEDLADTPNGDASWAQDSPMAALRTFLQESPNFVSDPACGKFLVSFAPQGFLLRRS